MLKSGLLNTNSNFVLANAMILKNDIKLDKIVEDKTVKRKLNLLQI